MRVPSVSAEAWQMTNPWTEVWYYDCSTMPTHLRERIRAVRMFLATYLAKVFLYKYKQAPEKTFSSSLYIPSINVGYSVQIWRLGFMKRTELSSFCFGRDYDTLWLAPFGTQSLSRLASMSTYLPAVVARAWIVLCLTVLLLCPCYYKVSIKTIWFIYRFFFFSSVLYSLQLDYLDIWTSWLSL